jgi:hypothetical protein
VAGPDLAAAHAGLVPDPSIFAAVACAKVCHEANRALSETLVTSLITDGLRRLAGRKSQRCRA